MFVKKAIFIASLFLLLLPPIVHFIVVYQWAVNIPFYDDFEWGVGFLKEFTNEQSLWEKIKLLFAQHNQHRIIWLRLCIIGIYKVQGFLDFRTLVIIGNLSFFGLTAILFFAFRRLKTSLIYSIPLFFILHQLMSFNNIIVSYGVPNMSVIFFAILSFYLVLFKSPRYLIWGIWAGFIASFSNGSGVLVMPLLSIFSFFILTRKQLTIVLAATIVTIAIFFWGYHTDTKEIVVSGESFVYFFEFMGAYIPKIKNIGVKIAFLLAFLVLLFAGIRKVNSKTSNIDKPLLAFLLSSVLFLGGAGLMATLFRLIHKMDIPNWYFIYSSTFVAILYISFFALFQNKNLKIGFFAFGFFLSTWVFYKSLNRDLVLMKGIVSSLEADAANYKRNGNWAFLPGRMGVKMLSRWENDYKDQYEKGNVRLHHNVLDDIDLDTHAQTIRAEVEVDSSNANHFSVIHVPTSENLLNLTNGRRQFGFLERSDDKKRFFVGVYNWQNSPRQIINTQSLFNERGSFVISKKTLSSHIPAGTYFPGFVFISDSDKVVQKWAKDHIKIENW
ncbi:hypothetical protein SAMN06298216_1825 [Spirosomataceae bacterium TFI 002]|nr:hypothetical protein SAMN06298216_1825 [Spirosomataceae bacterium TFI 002]